MFRQYTIGDAKTVSLQKSSKAAHNIINAVKVEDRDPVAERGAKTYDALTFGDVFYDWYQRHTKPKLARHITDLTHCRNHAEGEFARTRIADLRNL